MNLLDRIETKLSTPGSNTDAEEARLLKALTDHNHNEETGLYVELDRLLNEAERDEIFSRMKKAAWVEDS
jgi:hypothetical protein